MEPFQTRRNPSHENIHPFLWIKGPVSTEDIRTEAFAHAPKRSKVHPSVEVGYTEPRRVQLRPAERRKTVNRVVAQTEFVDTPESSVLRDKSCRDCKCSDVRCGRVTDRWTAERPLDDDEGLPEQAADRVANNLNWRMSSRSGANSYDGRGHRRLFTIFEAETLGLPPFSRSPQRGIVFFEATSFSLPRSLSLSGWRQKRGARPPALPTAVAKFQVGLNVTGVPTR